MTTAPHAVGQLMDELFRREGAALVASLARRLGIAHLHIAEDAVQDALVQAMRHWPFGGIPNEPRAWLRRVATNRALDILRQRARREQRDLAHTAELEAAVAHQVWVDAADDDLRLLFGCAHPALSADAAVTLMLKTVGGLSVVEIAHLFLAEPETIAQRLVRARRTLARLAEPLTIPDSAREAAPRRAHVATALYLMFTGGHTAREGTQQVRAELCREALRLARRLAGHPILGGPDVHALAALFALQSSRLRARSDTDGMPVLLSAQEPGDWDQQLLAVGAAHLERAASASQRTRWHLEAEIAAAHALRAPGESVAWDRVLLLYDALQQMVDSPVVTINRAVAERFVRGPQAAAHSLSGLDDDPRVTHYPWYHVLRARLADELGRPDDAQRAWRRALACAVSHPQRAWIERESLGAGVAAMPQGNREDVHP